MNTIVDNLLKTPKKDNRANTPKTQVSIPNFSQQADLLYLPNDRGYKYALVVVDLGSKLIDAVPLKTKKPSGILEGFKTIYKRGVLNKPVQLELDNGSEFKGVFKQWADKNGINLWYKKPGRHRQQAVVERANQLLGNAIHKRMLSEEVLTNKHAVAWVSVLPDFVKELNIARRDSIDFLQCERRSQRKQRKSSDNLQCSGDSCILLEEGTKVRVQLDNPIDYVTRNKVQGRFRSADIKWDPTIRTIVSVILKPNQPPLYLLNSLNESKPYESIGYTKNQLQVVPDDEQLPSEDVIIGTDEYYIPEKILDKTKINGRIHYLIKWKGYPKSESTWESRTKFMEDQPVMVRRFEKASIQRKS